MRSGEAKERTAEEKVDGGETDGNGEEPGAAEGSGEEPERVEDADQDGR